MTTDRELLQKFAAGDQAAFAEIVQRHLGLVHAAARRQTPADSDDVAQAVFLLLSQRAETMSGHGGIAGWLLKATRYCCMNVRRMQKRRTFHEQKAGTMMPQEMTPSDHAEITSNLDAALERLSPGYREAVALRYMEGRSIIETAQMLGLSEPAAAKRAARGLEKLREMLRHKHAAVTGQTLAGFMLLEAAKLPPAGLATSVTAAAGKTALVGKAGLLAHATGKALWLAKLKAIAAVCGIVAGTTLAAVAGGTAIINAHAAPIAAPVPATEPIAATPPEPATEPDEKKIAGTVALAMYQMLLDPAAAAEITGVTQPIDAKTTFYTLRHGSASAVRAAIHKAQAAGNFVQLENNYDNFALGNPVLPSGWSMQWNAESYLRVDSLPGNPTFSRTQNGVEFSARPKDGDAEFQIQMAKQQAKIEFNFNGTSDARELPLDVQWQGIVPAGEAVVLVGDMPPVNDQHLISVIVSEAYRAKDYQAGYVNHMFDPQHWIERGPMGARAWADRAWVWNHENAATIAENEATQQKWTRKLSNGTTITLLGVSSPRKWPFCWWNADGAAIPQDWWGNGVSLNSPLAIALKANFAGENNQTLFKQAEWDMMYLDESTAFPLRAGDNSFTMYLPVGAWKEQSAAINDETTVGDASIFIKLVKDGNNHTDFWGKISGDVPPTVQIHLTAALKDGTRLEPQNDIKDNIFVPTARNGVDNEVWFRGDPRQVDQFIVSSRAREKVVFENFATVPNALPPESVSADDIASAETVGKKRQADEKFAAAQKRWAAYDAMPRDPKTPAGSMRLMVDGAAKGDVAEVKKYLAGDPDTVAVFTRAIVQMEQLQKTADDAFGKQPAFDAVQKYDSDDESVEGNFLDPHWKIDGDSAVEQEDAVQNNSVKMIRKDGRWQWVLDSVTDGSADSMADLRKDISKKSAGLESLTADIQKGKIKDADAFAARFDKIMDDSGTGATTQAK